MDLVNGQIAVLFVRMAYHHGALRPALVEAALAAIAADGASATSLRAVARRAGVSHAAATYHFGDKAGLFTAIAIDGFRMLADALKTAEHETGSFLEVGVAYVRFSVTHRAHFEVMYRPDLYHADDPELRAARSTAGRVLYGTSRASKEQMTRGVAAWSLVHGLATLFLNGNLPPQLGDDPAAITRAVAKHLQTR